MRRAIIIKKELTEIKTVEGLTQVFESIASMHIANIRARVVSNKVFFAELWKMYGSVRVDPKKRLKSSHEAKKDRNVMVLITSEGKFGTVLNDAIIDAMLAAMEGAKETDIVAIGTYGAGRLQRRGMAMKKVFTLPVHDVNVNVSAVVRELEPYGRISVFYQTYTSLRIQKVARIDLLSTVRELGKEAEENDEALSSEDYIFEPNINEIADYMESVMMGVALTQVIMEAKLAGYASRYNTMSAAKDRAGELVVDYKREYYRSKRDESDERSKEVIKAVKYHAAQESGV